MLEFESLINIPTPVTQIFDDLFEKKDLKVFVKRDDLTHEYVSGNKFRKLKYNLLEASRLGFKRILTFGGAYSNHIAAVAEAGHLLGFDTLGIIRGDELNPESSPTLSRAASKGMQFVFVSRGEYRQKEDLIKKHNTDFYIVPEGGSNSLALAGVAELLDEQNFTDYVCAAVGTGGTMAGLLSNRHYAGNVLGIAVLKNADFLRNDISSLLGCDFPMNADLETRFHFGGYAKYDPELIDFIKSFQQKHSILLDQVYTGKMIYGVYKKIEENYFQKGSSILLLHTGGLQGRVSELYE